jgi:hypothetical protein
MTGWPTSPRGAEAGCSKMADWACLMATQAANYGLRVIMETQWEMFAVWRKDIGMQNS